MHVLHHCTCHKDLEQISCILSVELIFYILFFRYVLSDFINLTQVHNFMVSVQDSFTFRRLSVFTVSFTRILQVLMQIMKRFALVMWFWYRVYNQKVLSSSPRKFFLFCFVFYLFI